MPVKQVFCPAHYEILDGAFGTMLQQAGLGPGEIPELLCLQRPELVENIHRQYVDSGAGILCANTFGANARKLAGTGSSVRQVVQAAVTLARRACKGRQVRVALDVGPLGELLEPNGTLSFSEAYDMYRELVLAGTSAGVDLILFETMTDLYELKAGVLAAKENSDLPVLASMSFEQNGRTFTGCCVESMAATLTGLGVDGLGINCSLGPVEILPLARRLCAATPLPVFIKPNAGLPDPATGRYATSAADFCEQMQPYKALGVAAVGGCCGTTPQTISLLAASFGHACPPTRRFVPQSVVCSPTQAVTIDRVTVIGERINPTGKKRLKEALRQGDLDYILQQGLAQAQAGARILDVNVGLPEIDEVAMLPRVVKALQGVCELPLQLDSTNPQALEAALRVYNGKPIVNSVNAEEAVLQRLLPICKKYGAAVVGLTLDEKGIPQAAAERFALAEKIVAAAQQAGIPKEDVCIDCLTLTASAQQEAVAQTLLALRMVRERLGVQTVLGVSNISFGLPRRDLLNTAFLTLAMGAGLRLPILNPNAAYMMDAVRSFNVLMNVDKDAGAYIRCYADSAAPVAAQKAAPVSGNASAQGQDSLFAAVLQGLAAQAEQATRQALLQTEPEQLVNDVLIPALDEVGARFEQGRFFLPQLLQAAGAAQAAFAVVDAAMAASGVQTVSKGKIVLATVKGDIHDIGKNIVKTVLKNYGYTVIDLGRDVPPAAVVQAASSEQAPLVGLSALMTTTLPSMEQTIRALRAAGLTCKVMVGGAVLTPAYAKTIGADYYAKDAKAAVDIAKQVLG